MTMRLSARSLAGTARTLVAVGSSSEACMFLAIALAAPRSGFTVTSSASSPCDFAGLVDPAAGLLSPFASAPEERAAVDEEVAPLAVDPDDEVCDEAFAVDACEEEARAGASFRAGALPFALLPLLDDDAVAPVDAPLPDEPVDDASAPGEDAPVDDAEPDPATFSPSAGA